MVNNNYPVDLPKTYTVSYFDETEWNKDLTPVEIEEKQTVADLQNQLGEFEKGYGPCVYKNYNCSCNCPRADYPQCNCISDLQGKEKWIKLFMACPSVKKYDGLGSWFFSEEKMIHCPNKNQTNWVDSRHSSYYIWISTKARMRCEKTDCSTSHMSGWSFNCGDHGFHKGNFIKGSFDSFSDALTSVLNNMDNNQEVDEVLFNLMRHMKRNPW